MSNESFVMNAPHLIQLMRKWKIKLLVYSVALALLTAGILVLQPNKYYSYVSAIATNTELTDKGYLFNEHINNLHPSIGSYADLERLYATAILDTSYKYLIEKYNLVKRYKVQAPNQNIAVQKTILLLSEEDLRIEKTENGFLRIHVLHFNPDTAALMANDLMQYVNGVCTQLQKEYNQTSLRKLDSLYKANLITSTNPLDGASLQKLKDQFRVALSIQQPALRIVEPATPSLKHFKPKRLFTFISTMLLGLLAAITCISIWESLQLHSKKY